MVCYSPIRAYRVKSGRNPKTGKWPLTFKLSEGYVDMAIDVPCGQCVGCRLDKSRQWAIRCMHEASLHDKNCFITLTYNNENLPFDGSLRPDDFTRFMKRLRKKFGDGIRYFHCGEYGSKNMRPHYHACLFNMDFDDKEPWSINLGHILYRSSLLESLWPYGFCTIGDVSFESAAYVARYIMKKVTGDNANEHYKGKIPEYTTMSRRPGLANVWINDYLGDVYPNDSVVIRKNLICRPPRYYDNIYDNTTGNLNEIKVKRRERAAQNTDTVNRVHDREIYKEIQVSKLIRPIESNDLV